MGLYSLHGDIGRYDLMGPAADAGHWAGLFLIAGLVTFLIGAALFKPREYQGSLSDTAAALHRDAKRLRWIHSWMIVGTVVGVIGVTAFREMQAWSAETLWSSIGLTLWVMAAVLWIFILLWRLTAMADAVRRAAESGALPEWAEALASLATSAFLLHLLLAYVATFFLGLSVVAVESMPQWIGWAGMAFGAFMAMGNAARIAVFQPPVIVHLWPLVLGITILVAG